MERTVSVDDAIAFLNSLIVLDRNAVTDLVQTRVPCNLALAEHPTVQVGMGDDGKCEVGLLGILNGLFGIDERGRGFIAATIDDEAGVIRFGRTGLAE